MFCEYSAIDGEHLLNLGAYLIGGRPGGLLARLSPLRSATGTTAVIAPVLFGFMFGDIGHGAVLLVAGLLLQRRFPMLRLLAYGGVMSMLFGAAFGSVFARCPAAGAAELERAYLEAADASR